MAPDYQNGNNYPVDYAHTRVMAMRLVSRVNLFSEFRHQFIDTVHI